MLQNCLLRYGFRITVGIGEFSNQFCFHAIKFLIAQNRFYRQQFITGNTQMVGIVFFLAMKYQAIGKRRRDMYEGLRDGERLKRRGVITIIIIPQRKKSLITN